MVTLGIFQAMAAAPGQCPTGMCPASSFTAIAAAFATEGYWVQADIIDYMTLSAFGLWTPMLYVLAAIAGLIGVATGMPMRNYMWFFIGPALYWWLLDTRVPAHGVQWMVANRPQDQAQVWKLAETGLYNNNKIIRDGVSVSASAPPSGAAQVAMPFLWFDELISSTVQAMTGWFGVYSQKSGTGGKDTSISVNTGSGKDDDRWYLMSNLKWAMMENITNSKLANADMRDAFITYLSSECGDELSKVVDKKNYIAAANSKTGRLPSTIFLNNAISSDASTGNPVRDQPGGDYDLVTKKLANRVVPIPRSVRNVWTDAQEGAFSQFADGSGLDEIFNRMGQRFEKADNFNCADYLYFLIQGFRWESGHIYFQLVSNAPKGMKEDDVIHNLFYGWGVKDGEGNLLQGQDLRNFVKDLVLVHLFRNEMALAPGLVDRRFAPSVQQQNYVEAYTRTVGSTTRYGEVYSWALMMPYLQGVLLYFFSMLYPFACMLMVVPGWHKSIITWASFWLWLKLWDVGFAAVIVLERSIWSILGHNSKSMNIIPYVTQMVDLGRVKVEECAMSGSSLNCPIIPKVTDGGLDSLDASFKTALEVFDRSFLLASSLDFDLANGYYIYLMAALYFAVPGVIGQLVLGAKAGAASMATNLSQNLQQDSGKAAGQGKLGAYNQDLQVAGAALGQAAYAASMRKSGFAGQALDMGNMAAKHGQIQSAMGTYKDNMGIGQSVRGMENQSFKSGVEGYVANAYLTSGAFNMPKNIGKAISPAWGAPGKGGFGKTPYEKVLGGASDGAGGAGVVAGASGPGKLRTGWRGSMRAFTAAGGIFDMRANVADLLGDLGSNNNTQAMLTDNMLADAAKANLGIGQFKAGGYQTGFNAGSNRMQQMANFQAESDSWQKRRDWGNRLAGESAALGVMPGSIQPGQKPISMEGMAMSGMYGSGAKNAGNYFDPKSGQFFGMVDGMTSRAQAEVGSGYVKSQYKGWSLEDVGNTIMPAALGGSGSGAFTKLEPVEGYGMGYNSPGHGTGHTLSESLQGGTLASGSTSDPAVRSGEVKDNNRPQGLVPGDGSPVSSINRQAGER